MNNNAAGVAARFALLDALRRREVAVFGPSTPGQTRTPNEGNGTPKRDIFFGTLCVCIADRHRGSWSSSGGGDVAAAAAASSPLESWAVVLCLRCGACALCILALGHSPAAAWLFAAAAYLLCCCCCDDHGGRREEDPSPSDWNTLPSEPSDPSHCLLERSTQSQRTR